MTATTDQQEQVDARLSHEDAVHAALQSIADDAVWLTKHGAWQEYGDTASVLLGRLQNLTTSIEAWRALGGQTTDERLDFEGLFFAKGTGL